MRNVEMTDLLHQLLSTSRIDASSHIHWTGLVPWMQVIHDIVGVAEAIVILLGSTQLPELIELALEGQWDTIQCRGRFDRAGSMQDRELVQCRLALGELESNIV